MPNRLDAIRGRLLTRAGSAARALSSWINEKQEPAAARPRPGLYSSGARSDYDTDNYVRKATPERLGSALRAADAGDTFQQYEVFEEAERDPVVGRVYFKRRLAITSKELQIIPAAPNNASAEKAADLVREMLLGVDGVGGMVDFDKSLFHLTDAVGKAFAVAQVVWEIQGGRFVPVRMEHWPQREFQLGDPTEVYDVSADEIRIITDTERSTGVPLTDFPEGTWLVHRQKNWSQPLARAALFRSVVWYWMFKRFGTSDWSIFLERYGVPPRIGKYAPGTDKAERDELWQAVLNMGKDHACIHPDNATIELLEMKGLTAGAPHPEFIDYCNDMITTAISGNTMSTTQGDRGARSAKEAYQWDEDQQTGFDCKGLAATLRQQLAAPLVRINLGPGYPVPLFEFKFENTEDLNERAKRDEILHGMGKAIPISYIEQTYSVPEPEDGEPVLPGKPKPVAPVPPQGAQGGQDEGDEPEPPPPGGEPEEPDTAASAATGAQLVAAAKQALREAGLAEKKSSVAWVISHMLSSEP